MTLFEKKVGAGEFEIVSEGIEEVMKINYENYNRIPSIEDDENCMASTIDKLIQSPAVTRIVFHQRRTYLYDYQQTLMLKEIANVFNYLMKQKKALTMGSDVLSAECLNYFPSRYQELQYLILSLLKKDPLGMYVETKRILREQKIRTTKMTTKEHIRCQKYYTDLLEEILNLMNKTRLINAAKPSLDGLTIGDRSIYRLIFRATVTPDFIHTILKANLPLTGKELDAYNIDENTEVMIFETPGDIKNLYHLTPPEFKLDEDQYELLDLARNVLASHKPKAEEFIDPDHMRRNFFNIGRDLITELAQHKGFSLEYDEIQNLARILVRYTVGFGLLEVLLKDEKVQDITVNGPIGGSPIFIVHQDYGDCVTNIIPSNEDGLSWATKFRLISGRPLDEANPVLDTELIVPRARARVSVISNPLNPEGLGYALRRHRDKPWTLPLYINNKFLTPLASGLLSFLIDGSRTFLIAGTRSSGKTSLLGSLITEIMRKYRIITLEDSITGDSEILVKRNNRWERTTIGALIDSLIEKYGCWYNLTEHEILGNEENLEILAMDKKGKILPQRISKFIRHKVKKPIYKITTRTGREIKVTGDHSLFGLDSIGKILEVRVNELKKGDFIATPRSLPVVGKDLKKINLLDHIDKFDKAYVYGGNTKEFLKKHHYEVKQLGKEYKHNLSLRAKWFREGIIHIKILKDLRALGYNINEIKDAYIKGHSGSRGIPIRIKLNKNLLTLIGLWLADGCYDSHSTLISSTTKEEREIIYSLAKELGLTVKMHSDKFTLIINSNIFKTFLREVLELKGDAYTKRIPNWVFSLPNEQIKYILCGLFSGDGSVAKNEIIISLSSINMLKDIQTLLLRFEIIYRIGKITNKINKHGFGIDKTYRSSISSIKSIKLFKQIGFLQEYKKNNLDKLANKISTHDTTDIIPLNLETKKELKNIIQKFNHTDYIKRNNNIGRTKMSQLIQHQTIESSLLKNMEILASSDIFWDEVRNIEIIENFNDYVYDLSVPECESFITENIIAHNTLELPVKAFRELRYNIQPMKVRSALTTGGTELAAEEGIRTSLRLGDSCLIVGEVRSVEAKALYEAMRIGALANVVAGTIHGADPYGVFDRVVNDLQVPRTSFKATDIIVVANPIKTADGLHSVKRVTQITEVRKHWEKDPLREDGFVDLMKYDPKLDQLVPTENLVNGETEIVKSIAGSIREFAGDWDAVWSNIQLRSDIKKTLVGYAVKSNKLDLLEADFTVRSNDQFHRISENVREEIGSLDSNRIFLDWETWLKREVRKKVNF